MGHIDDVRVPHAARDVVPGIIEEEDEAHLINGAGTPLEKKRETDGETKIQRHSERTRQAEMVSVAILSMNLFSFLLNLQLIH